MTRETVELALEKNYPNWATPKELAAITGLSIRAVNTAIRAISRFHDCEQLITYERFPSTSKWVTKYRLKKEEENGK